MGPGQLGHTYGPTYGDDHPGDDHPTHMLMIVMLSSDNVALPQLGSQPTVSHLLLNKNTETGARGGQGGARGVWGTSVRWLAMILLSYPLPHAVWFAVIVCCKK